jgi:ribose 1,5-bisphosphokinase
VTDVSAISGDRSAGIGPGRLILVVGPSGAGKDTLIGLVRAACADDGKISFPRRVVTREASHFEDNEQLSGEAFRQALAWGEFAMHWQAHGHGYALRRAIEDDVRAGRTVIANVSRTVIDAMRRVYANVLVVSITAPKEVLEQRLAARARSSDGEIGQRLRRTVDETTAPDVTIVNVGSVEDHARELIRIVRG